MAQSCLKKYMLFFSIQLISDDCTIQFEKIQIYLHFLAIRLAVNSLSKRSADYLQD